MLLLAVLAAEEHAPLIMPNWAFALIAFIIFVFLGFVTWSFRDVANRHSHRVAADSGSADTGPGEHAHH